LANLKKKDHVENVWIKRMMILKYKLKKQDETARTAYICIYIYISFGIWRKGQGKAVVKMVINLWVL